MKVLQIVSYISPDGAYGGPVRVALNQAKALRKLGHEVVVSASAGGFDNEYPEEFDDYPVQLFPGRRMFSKGGFAWLTSPGLLRWLVLSVRNTDVVHIHLARDLVTLPAAVITLLSGKPLVVQTHGMIAPTKNPLAWPIDRILTRPVIKRAKTILYLTERERLGLVEVVCQNLNFEQMPNGVGGSYADEEMSKSLVQSKPEILYLARLHTRKRPILFVEAAIETARSGVSASFRMVGPDEGEASKVQDRIADASLGNYLAYEGALDPQQTKQRIADSDIYVLPSIDEPFPMSVLEALAAGKPVVVTESCGLAPYIEKWNAGIVVDESKESLINAIQKLIREPELRKKMGAQALELVRAEFRMESISQQLSFVYQATQ